MLRAALQNYRRVPPAPRPTPSTGIGRARAAAPRQSLPPHAPGLTTPGTEKTWLAGHPYFAKTHPYATYESNKYYGAQKAGQPPPGQSPAQGAPPQGAPTGPQQMPWDTQYEGDVGTIRRNLQNTEAGFDYEQNQTGQNYGYQWDPISGKVAEDPSNPFSRRALLVKAYGEQQNRTRNSMAAAGQLYAGSLQNATEADAYRNTQQRDTLLRDFQSRMNDLRQRRVAAEQGADEAINSAGASRLDRSLTAGQGALAGGQLDPGEAPAPAPAPGPGPAPGKPPAARRPPVRRPPPAPRVTPSTRPRRGR